MNKLFILLLTCLLAQAAQVTIMDLQTVVPSTNTYIEVQDQAATPRGRKVQLGTVPQLTVLGTSTNWIVDLGISGPFKTAWTAVTADGTNSVINLEDGPNFIYTLSTSNYIIFSNLVVGARGSIKVLALGTPRQINFSSSYCYINSNTLPAVIQFTNVAWIAYSVDVGTDATNVNLGISRN